MAIAPNGAPTSRRDLSYGPDPITGFIHAPTTTFQHRQTGLSFFDRTALLQASCTFPCSVPAIRIYAALGPGFDRPCHVRAHDTEKTFAYTVLLISDRNRLSFSGSSVLRTF